MSCPPGLPSFYLWDSKAALARYQQTGDYFSICDFPSDDLGDNGVSGAHVVLHALPLAVLKAYPFASRGTDAWSNVNSTGWHFAIRLPSGSDAQIAAGVSNAPSGGAPLDIADVPLAMFSGLVHELTTATVDTSANALSEAWQLIQDEYNAVMGNEAAAIDYVKQGLSMASASWAQRDQAYYDVTVTARSFRPVTTGDGWTLALNAVKSAHQSGSSIAAALRGVAANGVRPSYFGMIADLHDENEARALECANDPQFPSLGWDRGATLAAAGAANAPPSYARYFSQRPAAARGALLASLSPSARLGRQVITPASQPARSLRDLSASPPAAAPSSGHLDPFIQLGISILVGGVVGGVTGEVSAQRAGLGAMAGATVGGLGYLGVRKLFPEHFTTNEPLPPETKIVQ